MQRMLRCLDFFGNVTFSQISVGNIGAAEQIFYEIIYILYLVLSTFVKSTSVTDLNANDYISIRLFILRSLN